MPGGVNGEGAVGLSRPTAKEYRMSATDGPAATSIVSHPLPADELRRIDAYWRAANYLSVGQIYLLDNPLLKEPLRPEHMKPRLLGH